MIAVVGGGAVPRGWACLWWNHRLGEDRLDPRFRGDLFWSLTFWVYRNAAIEERCGGELGFGDLRR